MRMAANVFRTAGKEGGGEAVVKELDRVEGRDEEPIVGIAVGKRKDTEGTLLGSEDGGENKAEFFH